MGHSSVTCQRCHTPLRAVAFLDVAQTQREELDVYCGPCSKVLEREALRSWALKWATALTPENQRENFLLVLEAAWAQGFVKARTFEEGSAVFELSDNPFGHDFTGLSEVKDAVKHE